MNIELKNIYKSYGENPVLKNFSYVFPEKEINCIMGPSGCGKTTLLQLIMGFEKADKGEILGVPYRELSAVFQEDRLCEDFTAYTNVAMVCERSVSKEEIIKNLQEVGLKEAINKPISKLSGGMKRRVAIVRAIMARSKLIIMDEPFKGLDEKTAALVIDYVKKRRGNTTIILVTHSIEEAELIQGKLLFMK